MEKDVKSKGWGGKRTGAGRKSTVGNVKSFTLKVPRDVADILARVQGGKAAFVCEAVRALARERGV